MIYFDNAATTFPKPRCVLDKTEFCLKKYCGNAGRSSHRLSLKSSEAIYEARENVVDLLGLEDAEQVVFSYNATYCLNLAIKTFINGKCHIITSDFEHNSVIRPLEALKKKFGVEYTEISSLGDVYQNLSNALREDTKGIVASIASNVTGAGLPLPILSKFAEEKGLFLIIDASQAIGHTKINLKQHPCDALCAPGHKALFGIQGCGFTWFRSKERKESFIEGGSGSDSADINMPMLLPDGYEAGTLATPAIVTLGSGIKYIKSIGVARIEAKLNDLSNDLSGKLSSLKEVTVYPSGTGLLSFNIGELPSSYVVKCLDKCGLCLRGGLHCAPSVHRHLGTMKQGAVRASFSYLNRHSDNDKLYYAIKSIIKEN